MLEGVGGGFTWGAALVEFDRLLGEDNLNVPPQLEARYEKALYYRLTLWLYLPAQIALVLFSYDQIINTDMALNAKVGLALSMAVGVGFGATLAHELCHHPARLDRFIGVQVLCLCGMANFHVYHNYGHHNLVATPEDPGSARYGESFWQFTLRNIGRKLVLSWQIEARRLNTLGKPWLSPYNLMIWLTLNELAWVVGLTWYFGPIALGLFALQYAAPRFLLSVGDYLEHYGLSRRKLPSGEYDVPMILADRSKAWRYATLCTIASVIGGAACPPAIRRPATCPRTRRTRCSARSRWLWRCWRRCCWPPVWSPSPAGWGRGACWPRHPRRACAARACCWPRRRKLAATRARP